MARLQMYNVALLCYSAGRRLVESLCYQTTLAWHLGGVQY